jgi:hypothetical protein
MTPAFEKTQVLSVQIGYERGKREMVIALYELMAEAAERGEGCIKIDTLTNVCMRELRK